MVDVIILAWKSHFDSSVFMKTYIVILFPFFIAILGLKRGFGSAFDDEHDRGTVHLNYTELIGYIM